MLIMNELSSFGGGGVFSDAVRFDGATYFTRGGNFTGISDSQFISLAFWAKRERSIFEVIFGDDGGPNNMSIHFAPAGNIRFFSNVGNFDITSTVTITDTRWHHYAMRIDSVVPANSQLLLDSKDVIDIVNPGPLSPLDLTRDFGFGARQTGALPFQGSIAFMWFDFTKDRDMAANIRKFVTGASPVDLGADGSIPFGTAPILYLAGKSADFGTNKGTGGGLTLQAGGLTDSTGP